MYGRTWLEGEGQKRVHSLWTSRRMGVIYEDRRCRSRGTHTRAQKVSSRCGDVALQTEVGSLGRRWSYAGRFEYPQCADGNLRSASGCHYRRICREKKKRIQEIGRERIPERLNERFPGEQKQ